MRFMLLMYPGAKAESQALADGEAITEMMKFNEELGKAGVLLALDGLHPTSRGARIRREGGKAVVVDGPFTGSEELLGGYWILQVKSKEEAVAWATRCPLGEDGMIELRRLFEMSEFNNG